MKRPVAVREYLSWDALAQPRNVVRGRIERSDPDGGSCVFDFLDGIVGNFGVFLIRKLRILLQN